MVDNGQPSNNIQTIINEGQKTKMATHVLQFVFQGFTGFRYYLIAQIIIIDNAWDFIFVITIAYFSHRFWLK